MTINFWIGDLNCEDAADVAEGLNLREQSSLNKKTPAGKLLNPKFMVAIKLESEPKIFCPIVKRAIDELDCGDMILLSLDMSPERFVLAEIRAVPNYKKICQNCENNPYKEELR